MKFEKVENVVLGQPCFVRSDNLIMPSVESLIALHEYVIQLHKTGITPGIRAHGNIEFFVSKLLNKKFEKEPLQNALKISEEIILELACRHPFSDGNKRTALVASFAFLKINIDNHVNTKTDVYQVVYDKEKEIEEAKELELLAQWSEENCPKKLKECLQRNGIPIKEKVTEQHIRMFINKFLEKYVIKQ